MKKKTHSLRKNILREVRGTPGRFLAIFAITAIGAGFYAGLKTTGPDMRATGNHYFEEARLMDYRLLSTYGFTDDDVDALRARDDIEAVMPTQGMDVLVEIPNGSEAVRIHALPDDRSPDNPDYLNRITLLDGRMPEAPGECLADSTRPHEIGDVVRLSDENDPDTLDLMAVEQFTIVGICESPYYISFQRGNTTIGNGRIEEFFYVPQAAFSSDYYTEIYLRAAGGAALSFESDAYKTLTDNGVDALEELGETRAQARYDEILAEAEEAIADGEAELADAKAEAEEKLGDAWQDILDAEQEIADGWRELNANIQKLADADTQFEEGFDAIAENRRTLEAAQGQYNSGLAEYNIKLAEFNTAKAQLDGIDALLARMQTIRGDMQAAHSADDAAAFEAAGNHVVVLMQEIAAAIRTAGYTAEADGLEQAATTLAGMLPALSGNATARQAILALLDTALGEADGLLASLRTQLADGWRELQAGAETLAQSKAQLASGWAELLAGEAALLEAKAEFDAGRPDAEQKIADARKELLDAETKLTDGKAEYETEKADAEQKIADGEAELADARRELADLEAPEWIAFARKGNPGYPGYESDTNRIDAIALVIPPFFFLVAALVCLTSMTRMVEEQRTQIGILKALGFSRRAIMFKYLFYAGFATTTGAVAGVALGYVAFPTVIWSAYTMMYIMPGLRHQPNPVLTFATVGVAMLTTTIATLVACMGELRSAPSQLMRPKAPRSGQRVFLERIPFIWKRVSFNGKITVRNLFRYKRRFFMTVVGVAGCAALLLTGFGLRDSISGIVPVQYGEINRADMIASLRHASDSTEDSSLNRMTADIGAALYMQEFIVDATSGKGDSSGMTVYLVVAEDPALLGEFVAFKDRKSGEAIPFPQGDGVIISEKLADRLKVNVGNTIEAARVNESPVPLKVAGIMENYTLNYIYITPQTFEKAFGEAPEYTQLQLMLSEESRSHEAEILTRLISDSGVAGAVDIADLRETYNDMFESLNAVVWLIIIAAGLLAFVVLYNLTNINITERSREIATLKVLGFYPGEVSSYVFRESILLTLIGCLVGLVGGIFLHQFVIQVAEVDEVMFRRMVQPFSYVLSFLFTMLCTLLVSIAMRPKLRNVNMVESLKSVE